MNPAFSPEVLACARAVLGARLSTRNPFPARPLDGWAWKELVTLAQVDRITPLLAAVIHDGVMPATTEQRGEVFDLHAQLMGICLRLEADLIGVSKLLADAGVVSVVLKGSSFAHLDYDDPALRFFGDVDLLVRGSDWEVSAATLAAAGYRRRFAEIRPGFDRRFGKGVSFDGPQLRQVDLHRTFVTAPFGLMIDLAGLWSSTTTFAVGERRFLALDSDHRFLHACYHAAIGKHEPQPVPLRDLAGMLLRWHDPVDSDRVRRIAGDWGGQAVVARAVVEATDRLALDETELSDWARGYRRSLREERAMRTYLDPDMGFAARSIVGIGSVHGTMAKVRYISALVRPSRAYGGGRHGRRAARWTDATKQIVRLTRRHAP